MFRHEITNVFKFISIITSCSPVASVLIYIIPVTVYVDVKSPRPLLSYLWCQVLRGSTESFHGGTVCDPLFTQPKVCDLYVAVLI